MVHVYMSMNLLTPQDDNDPDMMTCLLQGQLLPHGISLRCLWYTIVPLDKYYELPLQCFCQWGYCLVAYTRKTLEVIVPSRCMLSAWGCLNPEDMLQGKWPMMPPAPSDYKSSGSRRSDCRHIDCLTDSWVKRILTLPNVNTKQLYLHNSANFPYFTSILCCRFSLHSSRKV